MSEKWVIACATADVDEEDVIRFDHEELSLCIYNTPDGFFATDGMCTHAEQHLEDGIVTGCVIECPLHQGKFDVTNGKALEGPVYDDLKTYPVKVENYNVYVNVNDE